MQAYLYIATKDEPKRFLMAGAYASPTKMAEAARGYKATGHETIFFFEFKGPVFEA